MLGSNSLGFGPGTYAGWLVGFLVLGTVVFVVLRRADFAQFLQLAHQAEPFWLAPALAAQGATYICATAVWWLAIRRTGHHVRLGRLIPLGVAKLFIDQILPSGGVSGTVLVTLALESRRISHPVALAALFVGLVSFNVAYLMVVLGACILLWVHDMASPSILALVTVFAVGAVAIPVSLILVKRWTARTAPSWMKRFPAFVALHMAVAEAPTAILRDIPLIAETVGCQLGIFALDAATLWLALHAIGIQVEPWVPFAAFIIGSVAATIGPIPLGIGTFEAATVTLLGIQGVPVESALTATLLFRLLSFWLPMAPGLWIARHELRRGRGRPPV